MYFHSKQLLQGLIRVILTHTETLFIVTTVPSTQNQPLCDISHGDKGSLGSMTAAGTTSAAALLATSSHFLQLPRAAGSHEFAPRPRPAGHVLAGTRHAEQLWVSGPRLWEGAGPAFVGFTGPGNSPTALARARSTAPCATAMPLPCSAPSAWALPSPAETLLGRGLGSRHGFLAASRSTLLVPKAC